MNLFVDTSFILALELTDDQHHDSALQCWRSLATRQPTLVATSYVFDELLLPSIAEIDMIRQLKLATVF
jgi:predicted nucleic acid-binding protein